MASKPFYMNLELSLANFQASIQRNIVPQSSLTDVTAFFFHKSEASFKVSLQLKPVGLEFFMLATCPEN